LGGKKADEKKSKRIRGKKRVKWNKTSCERISRKNKTWNYERRRDVGFGKGEETEDLEWCWSGSERRKRCDTNVSGRRQRA